MRYLAVISYDGSNFYGFQRLKQKRSVQAELEKVLSILAKKEVVVKGAGRTDAGVHAKGQTIHFDLEIPITEAKLKYVMNRMLPDDIRVIRIKEVDSKFHARLRATGKWYRYVVKTSEFDPFYAKYTYQIEDELDIRLMQEASKRLIGKHDFHNFTAGYRDDYEGNIFKIEINTCDDQIIFDFYGKGFYRYMVRNLVGTLLMIGKKVWTKEKIDELLKSSVNKTVPTAPASGLYLMEVYYEELK